MHPEQAVRRIRLTVWNLELAQSVGEELVQMLALHCERIEIAGEPELAGHAPAGFRIRTALQSGGKTVGQLITELGLPANQIRARISQMTDVIRIDGGGRNKEAVFGLLRHNELPF